MKRTLFILATGLFVTVAGFLMTSCTKEGPQGPAGINASATCQQCHNFADTIVAKIFQYDASRHASGSTVFEATNKSCAPCHSSQGFDEVLTTNADTTAFGITDAAPINCRTCHKIHATYTSSDWGLKTTAAFQPRYDKTVTIDLAAAGGISNLCARCHQARKASPWLSNPTSNVDSIRLTSNRWGPHHGPQGLILAGKGAFEIGAAAFTSSGHRDVASCSSCHSAYSHGNIAGGHTLMMSNTELASTTNPNGDNIGTTTSGCMKCHSAITNFDYNNRQTEIEGKYNELRLKLAIANVLDTNSMLLKGVSSSTPKYFKQKQLAVYWNFSLIDADRSMGVHNYAYTRDILDAGIAYMNSLGK